MTLPPLDSIEGARDSLPGDPEVRGWVRGALAGLAVGLAIVFAIALWLNPYRDDGDARTMETHRQLGLPPCSFYALTGLPCPSCGMTTSFALLVRGDVVHAFRANSVGMLLAVFGLALLPWSIASVVCKRTFFVRSLERTSTLVVLVFFGLMLLRWALVLGLTWWGRGTRIGF